MSISTLENAASRNTLTEFYLEADERTRAEIGLQQDFEAAARRCNVGAIATFAGLTKDWSQHARNPNAKRAQTVAEVMADSLGYGDGPTMADVMTVLCAVAWSSEAQTAHARTLINNMAAAWAKQNAVVE